MAEDLKDAEVKGILEVTYTWPDGRREVRYRRPYPSDSATQCMREILAHQRTYGSESPYSYQVSEK